MDADTLPNLRDIADRASVGGWCFICGDTNDCPTPAMCGVQKPEASDGPAE